jgi:SAM-dependent methyltransferase
MPKSQQVVPISDTFPTRGLPRAASDLAMRRRKPRTLLASCVYRAFRAGRAVLGPARMLPFCLNVAWIFRRLSFELSGAVWGDRFQCSAMGLSERVLGEWIPEGGTVLDVGCGSGRWCRAAAVPARRVVGIDANPANIDLARRVSPSPKIEFVLGDVTRKLDDQLGGETFDVALLVHVLEHVDDEGIDPLLQSIGELAGTLIVEVPDFDSDPLNLVRRELGCPFYTDADHVREYTASILDEQLRRNGWMTRHRAHRGGSVVAVAVRETVEEPRRSHAAACSS